MDKQARMNVLRRELEELGYAVILWCPDDFPGATEDDRQENFDANIETVVDTAIQRGNECIASVCEDEAD